MALIVGNEAPELRIVVQGRDENSFILLPTASCQKVHLISRQSLATHQFQQYRQVVAQLVASKEKYNIYKCTPIGKDRLVVEISFMSISARWHGQLTTSKKKPSQLELRPFMVQLKELVEAKSVMDYPDAPPTDIENQVLSVDFLIFKGKEQEVLSILGLEF